MYIWSSIQHVSLRKGFCMKAQFNAKVVSITKVTDGIRTFKIALDNDNFKYKAGQFAILGLPLDKNDPDSDWVCRAYSISSAETAEITEFYIILVKDGALTTRLFDLKEGDKLYMSPKPAGLTSFEGIPDTSNVLFISSGTGIAPYISIIRTHKNEMFNGKRKIALFHGVRRESDLAFRSDFEQFMKEYDGFAYFPVLSKDDANWHGLTGHVQDVMEAQLTKFLGESPFNKDKNYVFICGNPNMVASVSTAFLEHGFKQNTIKEPGNLRFDKH